MLKDGGTRQEGWEFEPRFRVVRVDDARRGIRLERIFWASLEDLAQSEGRSLGEVIGTIEMAAGSDANLSSALRVAAAKYLREGVLASRELTGLSAVRIQVQACPSSCFALSQDRKLIAYNPAFMSLVQSRMLRLSEKTTAQGVRLSLDVHFEDLIAKLKLVGAGAATVGYIIAVEQQVLRGRLNAVRAPLTDHDAIIGYILPG